MQFENRQIFSFLFLILSSLYLALIQHFSPISPILEVNVVRRAKLLDFEFEVDLISCYIWLFGVIKANHESYQIDDILTRRR